MEKIQINNNNIRTICGISEIIDGTLTVRILNKNNNDVYISENELIKNIKTEKLNDYNIFTITNVINENRENEIKNSIDSDLMFSIEKQKIYKLCIQHKHIFHLKGDKFTTTDKVAHKIYIKPEYDNKIIHIKQYRLPHADREKIER